MCTCGCVVRGVCMCFVCVEVKYCICVYVCDECMYVLYVCVCKMCLHVQFAIHCFGLARPLPRHPVSWSPYCVSRPVS